ncbi:MAG: Crp/Fnr family transcriptional regulator [Rhodospirillales bacterium]|nr:Crp/Fnr family transcriptional regulator [Rhodospirillales bacterium]
MADKIERDFSKISLFSSIKKDDLAQLANECRWQMFDTGRAIIDRGEEYSDVYILTGGRAHVLNYSENGKVIDYAALGTGDIFGELAAIDGLPRSASVVTQTVCTMAVISGARFIELVISNPQVSHELIKRMAAVIRTSDRRINDFSLLKAEQRVCIELLRLAEPNPGDLAQFMVHPMPTQSNFANRIGLARETVGRIFSRLARQEIISRKNKTVFLNDRTKLEEMALF